MKKISLVFGLVLLCSVAAFAQTSGPSVGGSFRYTTAQGTQTIEFEARTSSGRTTGGLGYTGSVDTPSIDVDGDGTKEGGRWSTWGLKVDVDCLVVTNNLATLSGIIADASDRAVIGRRMIMTVRDGGDGEPDGFTWGLFRNTPMNWVPADSELKEDDGWFRTWYASDFEVKDDQPVLISRETNPDCRSYPFTAFGFQDVEKDSGDIVVRP